MDGDKREGVSVNQIESFTKKHRFEVFFCLAFIFACLFSFVFFHFLPPIAMALGGVLGVLMPKKAENLSRSIFGFIFKQEQMTQLILGLVMLLLAIFLPFLIFIMLGLHGGKDIHAMASETHTKAQK